MRDVVVRDARPDERMWLEAALAEVGGRFVARRGVLHDLLRLPALVAERDSERVGLLVYDQADGAGEVELAALATPIRGVGAGTALVAALRARVPNRPIWVVTTNDNTDALHFYQRRGFVLRALRVGAVDEARRTLKPALPEVGNGGIPLRDELELVLPPASDDA